MSEQPKIEPADGKEEDEVPEKPNMLNIEKEYAILPLDVKREIFKQMSNFELIGVILSSEQFDDTAGDVLKTRRVHLRTMKLLHAPSQPKRILLSVIAKEWPVRKTDVRRGKSSNFMMGFDADADLLIRVAEDGSSEMGVHHSETSEANLWRHLARVVHTILTHFDCSDATIILGGDGVMRRRNLRPAKQIVRHESITPFPIYVSLAQPRIESSKKISVSRVVLTNVDFAPLLNWILPTNLLCQVQSKKLLWSGHSMVDGVRSVELNYQGLSEEADIVDEFIEKCSSSDITLMENFVWTQASINRVLTTNAISKKGDIRAIILYNEDPETDWSKMFADWSSTFEATHGDAHKRAFCTNDTYFVKYKFY